MLISALPDPRKLVYMEQLRSVLGDGVRPDGHAHQAPHVHQPSARPRRPLLQRLGHVRCVLLDGSVSGSWRLVRVGRVRGLLGDEVRPDGHAHQAPHVHQPGARARRRRLQRLGHAGGVVRHGGLRRDVEHFWLR